MGYAEGSVKFSDYEKCRTLTHGILFIRSSCEEQQPEGVLLVSVRPAFRQRVARKPL
jgi:hypothetical protein